MLKSLAVLLIGQYRSWPVVSNYILNFFKNRADKVDYFFVTWDTDWNGNPVIKEEILQHFGSVPAIVKILPELNEDHSFYRAAYMSKQVNLLKRRHEIDNNFVYDQVVETRHDVYIRRNSAPWNRCLDYEYQISEMNSRDNAEKINPLVISDLYIRTNSFTNDILANRYIKSRLYTTKNLSYFDSKIKFTDNHHLLADYLMENRLTQIGDKHLDYSFILNVRADPKVNLDLIPIEKLDETIVLCNFV